MTCKCFEYHNGHGRPLGYIHKDGGPSNASGHLVRRGSFISVEIDAGRHRWSAEVPSALFCPFCGERLY